MQPSTPRQRTLNQLPPPTRQGTGDFMVHIIAALTGDSLGTMFVSNHTAMHEVTEKLCASNFIEVDLIGEDGVVYSGCYAKPFANCRENATFTAISRKLEDVAYLQRTAAGLPVAVSFSTFAGRPLPPIRVTSGLSMLQFRKLALLAWELPPFTKLSLLCLTEWSGDSERPFELASDGDEYHVIVSM